MGLDLCQSDSDGHGLLVHFREEGGVGGGGIRTCLNQTGADSSKILLSGGGGLASTNS